MAILKLILGNITYAKYTVLQHQEAYIKAVLIKRNLPRKPGALARAIYWHKYNPKSSEPCSLLSLLSHVP